MGITSKFKLMFAASVFVLLAMTGYYLWNKHNTPFYSPINLHIVRRPHNHGRQNDRIIAESRKVFSKLGSVKLTENIDEIEERESPQEERLIVAASGKGKSEVHNKVSADNIQVSGDSSTEWDMIDSDHIDVALYSCIAKWAQTMSVIYRTVKCPDSRRTISIRNALGNVSAASTADVVIFASGVGSLNKLRELKELRRKKKPHQIWLYTTTESAFQMPFVPRFSTRIDATIFNMSFCYHSKAEIVAPFGAYIRRLEGKTDNGSAQITPKPDIPALAAWASSHCHHTFWNRTEFVMNLTKYLPMDLYGACGGNLIPRNEAGSDILKNYKFYLAFENSCCSFYITEKFWKALAEYESVPIVIGSSKSNYESVAPPNSFVYADDFDSMEDLANYIKKVAEDEALYNTFHEWRRYGKAEVYNERLVSPLFEDKNKCKLLNYLEKNAWRKNHPIQMEIDPFGPDWAGSCTSCGNHDWIKDYGLQSKDFTKRLYSLQMTEV
ncbi:Alpha-(1,3)-fucosyltransferase 5 [Holothuria leucospilota]|uniref:Fucosyltransferase n=1 Tax=Holothuria leucospilota TaxID=206669 RepID=A0A9Q1HI13_HOLLE|nr:Alpha-(1,3)-fucosyltransferase 5 [Holothuria leucospilota]